MDLFEQRLLAEGVRAIEGESPALSVPASVKPGSSFEERLLRRAAELDPQLQISTLFAHFKGLTKNLFILLALLLLVLGAGSVQQLFFSELGSQINFFWAFALFLIPNLLALSAWLLFFLRASLLTRGWLARFSLFLLSNVEKRFNAHVSGQPHFWPLFKCYFKIAFSGILGRYQLSAVTHLLWLSYFCGATLMLVIMLATHQVDFIWQTSILSLQSFQWLTELLAYIPNQLGIPVPDPMQIQQSNLGAVNVIADAQQSRFAWSSLLISSLLIYGVLPRFLLWLGMLLLLQIKRKQFSLNLSSPYYVQLRQQLKPNVTSLGVSDPDSYTTAPAEHLYAAGEAQAQLPAAFYPVAVELSAAQLSVCSEHVKQYAPEYAATLKNICDFQGQQSLLQNVENISRQAVVLYVSLMRVPDRGLLGFIKSLTELGSYSLYLLLIDEAFAEVEQSDKRRSDWYTLAARAGIPLDNIIHLKSSHSAGEI